MNNKILFIIFTFCFILTGCSNNNKEKEEVKIGIVGNDYPIDRITVAKMIALTNNNKNEILSLDNVIKFKDVEEDSWYNKYVNSVYINKDMSGVVEEKFAPEESLTITQTQYLIDKYDKNRKIKIDDKNKDKPISYALWVDIYSKVIKNENIKEEEVVILATKDTNKSLKEPYAITDKGLYSFEGIDINKYINTKVKIFTRDKEVLAVTEVLELEPTLKRCYIEKSGDNFIDIFIGGAKKRLHIENNNNIQENVLADIKISGNNALSIETYVENTRGIINKVDNNIIRLNNTNYVIDNDFKVYKNIDGKIYSSDKDDLIIGEDIATFFVKGNENKIYGAIIDTKNKYEKIRVAINDSTYNNLYFDEIKLKANGGLKILVKGIEKNAPSLHIKKNQDFGIGENEIIIVEASDENDGIIFENLKRGYSEPIFYDKIEICKINNKYLVINNVDLEKYVESVLSSNIGGYKQEEMLKTLATMYRTMAIKHIQENNLRNIGANVDDSSKYQVYNNLKTLDNVKNIVNETKGQILTNNNKVIKPIYFGYSAGVTSNSGEIWPDKDYYLYPASNKEYIKHIKDFEESIYENLNEEVNSNIFYKTKDIKSIENDSKWFRWSTTLEEKDILKINENIKEIYKKEKYFIKTLKNNNYIYEPVEDIGKIKDINVKKRGESGNVMELEIEGDKNTVLIMTDLLIKKAFYINSVLDNNNQIVQNVYSLPSSNFVFDKIYDNNGYLKKIVFYGGGYGHGVGLSLYGAEKMAEQGKNMEEILQKYYKNVEIADINN